MFSHNNSIELSANELILHTPCESGFANGTTNDLDLLNEAN